MNNLLIFWVPLMAFFSIWAVCWMFVRRAEEQVDYPTDPMAQRLVEIENLDVNESAKITMTNKVIDMDRIHKTLQELDCK